mmetsp:Transcript_17925/g.57964  ORF Transcript_17925/g.57964 Transcript_17925/m.57964 type:complete len:86 (-) Transcript_17925:19-276(-)
MPNQSWNCISTGGANNINDDSLANENTTESERRLEGQRQSVCCTLGNNGKPDSFGHKDTTSTASDHENQDNSSTAFSNHLLMVFA